MVMFGEMCEEVCCSLFYSVLFFKYVFFWKGGERVSFVFIKFEVMILIRKVWISEEV